MVTAVEYRFGQVNRLPHDIEWLTDNPVLSLSKGVVATPPRKRGPLPEALA